MKKDEAEKGRSEALLPADEASAGDGRLEVAEEVNLDQQGDAARRVGQLPDGQAGAQAGAVAQAVAESLSPAAPGDTGAGKPGQDKLGQDARSPGAPAGRVSG